MAEPSRPEQLERAAFMATVQRAMAKHKAQQPLTPRERSAWAKWEAEEDERRGRRYVAAVPKKTYCVWSGRQTKILHDQADLYGIPLRGATIDVPAVIASMHDLLARFKHELAPLVKGDAGGDRPPGLKEQLLKEQVDLYRKKNEMLEDMLAERHADLVPRAEVHKLHVQLAKILRGAGERLHKQYGEQAAGILNVALEDFEKTIEQLAVTNSGESAADSQHAADHQ